MQTLSDALRARLETGTPTFIVDFDVRVLAANGPAGALLPPWASAFHFRPLGELLGCGAASEAGCGRGSRCRTCPVRLAVHRATLGERIVRELAAIELVRDGAVHHLELRLSAEPTDEGGQRLAILSVEPIHGAA